MTILSLLFILILIGVVLWLVNSVIPMPAWVRMVITVVAVILVIVVLLQAFGVWGDIRSEPVPRL